MKVSISGSTCQASCIHNWNATTLAIRAVPQIDSLARDVTLMISRITNTYTLMEKAKEDVDKSAQ